MHQVSSGNLFNFCVFFSINLVYRFIFTYLHQYVLDNLVTVIMYTNVTGKCFSQKYISVIKKKKNMFSNNNNSKIIFH